MNFWERPPVIEDHSGITVVREDLLPGGAKMRFLPYLLSGKAEVVYGTPFCGGAQLALSVYGKETGTKITLFSAKRKALHERQKAAFRLGAQLFQVPFGYMTNVQAKARAYAESTGAFFLPLGFDVPEAVDPFVSFLRSVPVEAEEIWCATGSGMLAKCLGVAFPQCRINGVVVGLRSKNGAQAFPENVKLWDCRYKFEQICENKTPFPACGNYEKKAWEIMSQKRKGRVLFWNVLG